MSELPRVLLCSFEVLPGPTGMSRRLTEYLRGLAGHFNVVVLSTKTPDHPHIEKLHGARLLRVPVGSGDLPSRLQTFDRAVRRQLESEEYALAHFTDPFGGYALCELRQQYDYKLIYEAQSFPSQELRYTAPQLEGDRKFLAKVRRQELFCLMNAERVLTGSKVTASLISTLGVPRAQVEVVRAPVDLDAFRAAAVDEASARPIRVVYLGSQIAWQGLPTMLRAVHRAARTLDLQLSIVGPSHPARRPLLDDLVTELDIQDRVTFEPPLPHSAVHALLRSADVCVVPLDDHERNRIQGGPVAKVAEYLAAGRPVIASDLPVCREVLSDECALFHEPGDAEDLARCLTELGTSTSRRARMGRAAQVLAAQNHDAARITARLRQIYGEIAGVGPRKLPSTELHSDARERTDPAIRLEPDPVVPVRTDPSVPTILATAAPSRPERSAADERRERRRLREDDEDATEHAAQPIVTPVDTPMFSDDVPVEIDTVVALAPPIAHEETPAAVAAAAPPPRPSLAPPPLPPPLPRTVTPSAPRPSPTAVLHPPEVPRTRTPAPGNVAAAEVAGPVHAAEGEPLYTPVPGTPMTPPPVPLQQPAWERAAAVEEPDEPLEIDADAIVEPEDDLESPPVPDEADGEVDTADDAVLEQPDEAPDDVAAEAEPPTELALIVPPHAADVPFATVLPPSSGVGEPTLELEVVSRMDAWFAQLVHGYCPPEGAQFARPTPPTNFPGREGPPPATVQPPVAGPQSFPSRSGEG